MITELDILYVDDEPHMIHLVEEAFAESPIQTHVRGVGSGREALAFLAREDTPEPDLVLLDKNLGGESGLDVLAELRAETPLGSPVVLFTSSDDPTDVTQAYQRGANAFVQKPADFDGLVSFAHGAAAFWGSTPSVSATA